MKTNLEPFSNHMRLTGLTSLKIALCGIDNYVEKHGINMMKTIYATFSTFRHFFIKRVYLCV